VTQLRLDTPYMTSQFSLVVGGPFYRMLLRARLVKEAGADITRRVIFLVLLTWPPLLVLALASGTAYGSSVKIPLLRDFSAYGRFLVGIPLLLLAEIVIDPWLQRVMATFASSGIVREVSMPAYRKLLETTERRRDSGLAELLLALIALFPFFLLEGSVLHLQEWGSSGISSWHTSASGGLSPAGWWFALVSTPVIRFLLFRWLWRYALWSVFALQNLKTRSRFNPNSS
jgi:hypothetical protein